MCGFDTRRAPRNNCSRFVCRYGFHEDVVDSLYVPILLYRCTRVTVRCPGDNSIRLRRTDAWRQNSTTTNARSMFLSLHGVHVVPSAWRSLTATVKSLVVWNSWSRCYAPHMRKNLLPVRPKAEGYTRRYLIVYRPPDLLYCGGCTGTRINRQPIVAIT